MNNKKLSVVTADKDKITITLGQVDSSLDRAQVSLLSGFDGTFVWDLEGENLECFLSTAPADDLIEKIFGAVWLEADTEKTGYAYQMKIIQIMQSAIKAELWEEVSAFDE